MGTHLRELSSFRDPDSGLAPALNGTPSLGLSTSRGPAPDLFPKKLGSYFFICHFFLIFTYNLKTYKMKEKPLNLVFTVWTIGLGVVLASGLTFAVIQLATGNYCSTASFEF